jgi:hypothetical protein
MLMSLGRGLRNHDVAGFTSTCEVEITKYFKKFVKETQVELFLGQELYVISGMSRMVFGLFLCRWAKRSFHMDSIKYCQCRPWRRVLPWLLACTTPLSACSLWCMPTWVLILPSVVRRLVSVLVTRVNLIVAGVPHAYSNLMGALIA